MLQVPYAIQLKRKNAAMEELFKEFIDKDHCDVFPIAGMDNPRNYRYKAATPFAPQGRRRVRSGFYAAGTHRIVPCKQCLVEDSRLRPILNDVARLAEELGIYAYDEDRGTGTLRHAVVRSALYTNDILLTIVTNGSNLYRKDLLIKALKQRKVSPTSIVQNVNTLQTNAILGRKNIVLSGSGHMRDKILGATFEIGATSFYQTNPRQTEVLYGKAIKASGAQIGMTFLDAYCGCGTIGICAAKKIKGLNIIGVERTGESIHMARRNAHINKLDNRCRFIHADATEYLHEAAKNHLDVDILMMDPPRAGSTETFLEAASQINPERIVYVSCNPKTQVRDIAYLRKLGWKMDSLMPVDMFPHTKHVETIVSLSRAR